jgi:hypothetical protein
MSQPLRIDTISAPGFYGLNTQDSPLDLNAGFALTAINCVIDQYGRVGAREGWTKVNSSSGDLGANDPASSMSWSWLTAPTRSCSLATTRFSSSMAATWL